MKLAAEGLENAAPVEAGRGGIKEVVGGRGQKAAVRRQLRPDDQIGLLEHKSLVELAPFRKDAPIETCGMFANKPPGIECFGRRNDSPVEAVGKALDRVEGGEDAPGQMSKINVGFVRAHKLVREERPARAMP